MQTYQQFYQSIQKPFFAPPPWVFGLAWSIIYPLIAIALLYTFFLILKKKAPVSLFYLFILNIIANVLFTPIQLGLKSMWPASADILFILSNLLVLEYKMFRYSKIVFLLLLPYLLWVAFASILQLTIAFTN